MNHPLDLSDLSLLVRALHKDVSDLDDRLRDLEAQLRALREKGSADVPIDLRIASRT
jgi:hypothetical protein